MKTPLLSHVLLLYLLLLLSSFSFLSPSTLLVQAARPLPLAVAPFHPPFLFTFYLPVLSPHYLTLFSLYHFLTRSPHLSLSQPPLLDIPALFSCSLQHNFLTHFLSSPWPPDQSLQDGIALGRGEGEHEMGG